MEKISIMLADDQTLFRQTLATLIKNVDLFNLVSEADSGGMLLTQLSRLQTHPDIVLIDMKMPGMDGLHLNRKLHREYPAVKVIVLSAYDEKRLISTTIEDGARSYLEKNCDKEELVTAIRSVHQNGFYMNEKILQAIQNQSSSKTKSLKSFTDIPSDITKREKEVLRLICLELSNAEIAEQLFLSIRTVEGHRNNLILKTGCKNTAGLVLFAVKNNIYDLALH